MNNKLWLAGKFVQHRLFRVLPVSSRRRNWRYSVFCNSYPKAGTNLLVGAVEKIHRDRRRLGDFQLNADVCNILDQVRFSRPGRIISAHEYYSDQFSILLADEKLCHLLIVRDLRDIAVSAVFYLLRDKSHRLHNVFCEMSGFRERLLAAINGIPEEQLNGGKRSNSIAEHAAGYIPFTEDSRVLVVRFEDLVGENGGGSKSNQLVTLRRIADHLDREVDDSFLEKVASSLFGSNTRTFRIGALGAWSESFEDIHYEAFENTGASMQNAKLGYP